MSKRMYVYLPVLVDYHERMPTTTFLQDFWRFFYCATVSVFSLVWVSHAWRIILSPNSLLIVNLALHHESKQQIG
jgi:hypothetical protein